MPRRLPPHRYWDPADARRELIDAAPGARLSLGETTIHATAVPLFRRAGAGLEQAIRLLVRTPASGSGVTVTVQAGERTLDRLPLEPAGTTTAHLFVPEVGAPTRFRLTATAGDQEQAADLEVGPQRKWSLYLVHHSHFDIGYTDPQATVIDQQLRYLDAALDLAANTDDWPDDAAFRWNVEVTYPLQRWLAARPRAARDELIARVKSGRIEINALPFSMHTEVYSIDELAWGLRFADELRERYGVEIVSAIQSDVPGATIGLLNLLTAAGIKYFAVAHNYAGRSVPFLTGGQELTRPFRWRAASDERLLVWMTDTPHGLAYMEGNMAGLAEGEAVARERLPDYLLALAERPYPYGPSMMGWFDLPPGTPMTKRPYPFDILHLRVQSTMADNAAPGANVAETVRDWNAAWAHPRLRLATNREFFQEAEARYGDRFAEYEGDWTDWWVDGVGSGARALGLNRRAQGTIRAAQTLHALADVVSGEAAPEVAREVEQTYEDLALFDEHTWGAANPWDEELDRTGSGAIQWGRKEAFAHNASERAATLLDAGGRRFATPFAPATDSQVSLLVFNPSGFARTDLVRLFVPAERIAPGHPIQVIDAATSRPLPFVLEPQPHPAFRARGIWLTFLAEEVPSVGYARYEVVTAEAPVAGASPEPAAGDPYRLETPFYRLTVDPRDGFITSIVDRADERELVDADAPFGFNEYIYDRYTSAPTFNHLSSRVQALDLSLFGARATAGHASLIARTSDAVAERLTVRLVAAGTAWLETTLTLPHGVKRVEIANRLHKTATLEKESVYFAFPFASDDPDPEYAIAGGVTSQAAPHVPGAARHMFALRHWLALRDARGAAAWATLEAPLVELGTIALPYAPFPPTIPTERGRPATIYSWALNNIWDTNFPPRQGGEMTFHYALASDGGQQARELGTRTGAALAEPLVGLCLPARRGDEARLTQPRGGFIALSDPLVQVVGVAPSRRGHDLVVYLHSLAPQPVEVEVAFPALAVGRLAVGTFLERDYREVELSDGVGRVPIAPGEYLAVGLDLRPST